MMQRKYIDKKVSSMEDLILEKVRSKLGFADDIACIRKLQGLLKFCDIHNTGVLSSEKFYEFMLKLHFVGVNKEIEELFNRYDDDLTGFIDYTEFAYNISGHGRLPKLNAEAKETLENLQELLQEDGIFSIVSFVELIRSHLMDNEESISLRKAVNILSDTINNGIFNKELEKLLRFFDLSKDGKVHIPTFLRVLRAGMLIDRKRLVKAIFEKLDSRGDGYITANDIQRSYVPEVQGFFNGKVIESKSASEIVKFMQGTNQGDLIYWPEFLDYYRSLSLGIEDNGAFEMIVRNSWSIAGSSTAYLHDRTLKNAASPTRRRMVVTHSTGAEEVVEIIDELGKTRLDADSLVKKISENGVRDICDIRV